MDNWPNYYSDELQQIYLQLGDIHSKVHSYYQSAINNLDTTLLSSRILDQRMTELIKDINNAKDSVQFTLSALNTLKNDNRKS